MKKVFKAAREKWYLTYRKRTIQTTADISSKTMENQRKLYNIFQVLEEKNSQPQILYPAKLSFGTKTKIKTCLRYLH